jgi:hypothetical protein
LERGHPVFVLGAEVVVTSIGGANLSVIIERIIHIEWEGPYSLSQLDTLNDLRKDYGLYQIYGHHPIYGSNVLLYIG